MGKEGAFLALYDHTCSASILITAIAPENAVLARPSLQSITAAVATSRERSLLAENDTRDKLFLPPLCMARETCSAAAYRSGHWSGGVHRPQTLSTELSIVLGDTKGNDTKS
jgi:hypothetical protein